MVREDEHRFAPTIMRKVNISVAWMTMQEVNASNPHYPPTTHRYRRRDRLYSFSRPIRRSVALNRLTPITRSPDGPPNGITPMTADRQCPFYERVFATACSRVEFPPRVRSPVTSVRRER